MNTTLNAVDGRLFLGREQRDALIDPAAKISLAGMERQLVQPGWAAMQVDKQTSAIWLAARLNRPESEVQANFDHFASSYFGRAITPGAVYDEIVKYEADQAALLTPSAPAGGVAQRGEAGPVEGETPAKKGFQFVRTFGAAFEQGGQDAAAGTFSMIEGALNTLGGTPKRTSPFTDPAFLDSYEQLRDLERKGLGETPEAERLRMETGAAVKAADADFLARKAEFENGTVRGALSSTARAHADFFYELSGAAMDRYGVDEAYRDTMFGKAAEMGGQMLATSALMAAGELTTAAKLGKLATLGQRLAKVGVQVAVNTAGTGQIYAGVTQERRAFQGEGYANEGWSFAQDLTDAGVQQAIEMVPFLDNAFEKALRHAPSRGGRVSLGEALKRFPMIAVHSGSVEAVEEVTQGAWHDFIVDQGYNDEMVDISNGKMDWAKRRGAEALAAFAGGVMMAGAMHGPASFDENRMAKRAERLLTAKDGGLFTARDFQLLRDARTDEQIRGMALGETLLRAANGDAAAMKEYNSEAAKQAFKQVDGLALADGKLGEVDGKPAFLRDNGDIVIVDLTDAAQAAEWERVKEKALIWKEAQAMQGPDGVRATSDMVDFIRQLQVERGGAFKIEANAKIETVLESVGGNRAKAQALIDGYIQAGALPAGSTIENVAAPMGASDTKFDEKTRKFVTSIRIAQGANPLVVLEESAHDYFKRKIQLGDFTEATVHEWRRQVEAGWEGKMNYTELHEWLGKYAVGYAMGKVQAAEASVLPASFRRYLERFAKFFRESLEFAAKVMQMERDNALPGDFLRALQEATGLDEARARRRHTQAELSAVFANLSPEGEVLANTAAQALADYEKLKEGYRAEIRAVEDAQNNREARHEKAVAAGFMERQRAIDFAKAKLEEALQALADNQLAGDEKVNVDGLTNEEEFVAELLAAVPVYQLDVQLSKQAEAVLMEYDQETEGSLSAEVRAERKAQRAETAANAAQAAARVTEMTGEDDNLTEAEAATLPSITASADGGFIVKSPEGVEVGKAADIETARTLALNWMDRQAREEERAQVMEDIGWGDDTELMAVVRKLGGIRAISTERADSVFGGELAAIADNMSFADRIRTFRKNGQDLDRLREALGEEGFEFETVTDMLTALDESTRGNPVYPNRTNQGGTTFSLVSTAGGLLAVHNTTEDKLRKMEELGGLAAPSMAVIKPSVSDYTSFGDITLIAPPSLIDPKGGQKSKVFNADVYSPRFPRISYRVDEAAVKRANKMLQPGYDALGGKEASDLGVSEIQSDGLKAVSDVAAVKWTFLKEEGINVDRVMRVSQPVPESLKRFELTDISSKWALYDNVEFQKAVGDYYKEDLKEMPELIVEYVHEETGLGRRRPVEDMADRIMAAKKPEVDTFRTRRALEEAITKAGLDGKFQEWVKANFSDVIKSKRVHSYNSRTGDTKFLPYDLDTVAKLMMKGGVRDNEGFNYGVGNIRAVAAKEFKSLADIRKSGDSLVTPAAMEAAKAESSHEFEDLVKELAPFYRYDAKAFGYLDDASQAFKELITSPSKWNEAYKDVPDELMKRVREFLVKLRNMPTEYFEGKIGRGVRLSELAGAVVPRDVSSDVRAILKKAGLRVVEYDEKVPDSRKAAVAAFSDQTFSLTPTAEPGQAKVTMQKESPVMAAIRQDVDEWFAKQKLRHWQALGLADVANMQAVTYVARVQVAQDAQRAVMSGKVVDQMDRVLLTYTSAMDRLVPGLGSALQRLTHVKQRNAARDKTVLLALADKIKALPNANEVFLQFQVMGRADNRAGVEGLAKLHGFTAELAAAEAMLTQLRRDSIEAGVPVSRFWSHSADWSATDAFRAEMDAAKRAKPGRVGEAIERVLARHGFTKNIDFYWPSKVFDKEGLAAWFGRSRDARIVEAYRTKEAAAIKAGRAMTEEDLTELIGAMVNGGRQGKAGPGSLKARTIANDAINIEVMQFYHTAIEAALLHVESMRTHILQMDFFGKSVQLDERNDAGSGLPPIDLGQSARVLFATLAASNQIDHAKEEALKKLIVSRFEPTPANRVVNVIRALGYAMSLGQVYSGQTATLDALAIGLREDHVNPLNMVLGLIQAATGKSTLTLAEAGIDTYDMGEDFRSNQRWEDKMVRWVFKHNLLTRFSRLYAQAGLNQALKAAQRQARAGDMDAVKRKRLERLFGVDGVARVMADLAAGRKTDDTLLYAFATVANYQPISPDQQSHFMRSSSTGKILFQFKSFLTVQFSGMRDDAWNEIRSGDAKRALNGTRFLIALAATLLMVGLPGDLLRSWLTGRTFILSDQVAARLLGLIGLSPYLVREGKRSGPSKVVAALAIPAVGGAADDIAKDVSEWEAVMTSKADVSYLAVLQKMRVWQNVPFVGKVYDDRFGHNADRNDKNREEVGWFVLTDPRADEKADAKNEATRKRLEEKYPNE